MTYPSAAAAAAEGPARTWRRRLHQRAAEGASLAPDQEEAVGLLGQSDKTLQSGQ